MQVQCKLALEAETDYILNSIWGTLLLVLVKFLAKMPACVGGAWEQEFWKWNAEVLILGLSLCRLLTSHISQQKQAGLPVRLTAVAFQYLRGDAAVWQLEEAVRREFFLLVLDRKKTSAKQMSHRTESSALCISAHLLNNILTLCLCFLFFRCRLEDIWCR